MPYEIFALPAILFFVIGLVKGLHVMDKEKNRD